MYTTPYPSKPWRVARATLAPLHDPPRVLVAEDDSEMRRLVVDALRDDGYDVREATDGNQLLVYATSQNGTTDASFDLIVSDVRMPFCTGLEVLEALRQANRGVPVILMTAFSDQSTRLRADALGAILFDKPFALDDLRTAVLNLLPLARI